MWNHSFNLILWSHENTLFEKNKKNYSTILLRVSLQCAFRRVPWFLFSLHTKSILLASENYSWTTDVTWTILMMSLPPWTCQLRCCLCSRKILDFIKNIFICGPKTNKELSFLGELSFHKIFRKMANLNFYPLLKSSVSHGTSEIILYANLGL